MENGGRTAAENYEEKIKEYVLSRAAGGLPTGVTVLTFGCQQNEADSEKLLGLAATLGFSPTDDPQDAGLILINTCAIREHAEQKVLSVIGGFGRRKAGDHGLLIGVCGCMPAQAHRIEQLKKSYPYVDFSLDPASLPRMAEAIGTRLFHGKRSFFVGEEAPPIDEGVIPLRRRGPLGWLSIMYGCNNFCSYCIVPYVRGRERSRSSADIIREAEEMIAAGYRDITLLGQNVNSYRGDCDFATLLSRLAALPGDFRIRFMTSHPKDVSDDLIRVIGECPKIAPAFHLPLQSGSNAVLHAMNRRYTMERYRETVRKLRNARPGIVLTSDIIVGFPGESDEDFAETLRALEEIRFDMVYSFLYSPRRGTPAAGYDWQISAEVKGERMRRLLDLQTGIASAIGKTYEGKTLRVLAEEVSKTDPDMLTGRTDGGKPVHFPAEASVIGEFLSVKIERADAYAMYGTPVGLSTRNGQNQ